MKVVAIIQARMGSTRLPGKVLKKVLGKPLLQYQLEHVRRSKKIDEIVVATTVLAKDDAIASLCNDLDVICYRGSETDVLGRYYHAATDAGADAIVRLTADCPLIDPAVIDKVIEMYIHENQPMLYVSNTLNRTFPRGMDAEIFSIQTLIEAYDKAELKEDREHVTRYIVNNPKMFQLLNVTNRTNYSHHRWTVDTAEDFTLVREIIEAHLPHNPHFTLEDTVHLLDKNPKWQQINAHIQQKKDGKCE